MGIMVPSWAGLLLHAAEHTYVGQSIAIFLPCSALEISSFSSSFIPNKYRFLPHDTLAGGMEGCDDDREPEAPWYHLDKVFIILASSLDANAFPCYPSECQRHF